MQRAGVISTLYKISPREAAPVVLLWGEGDRQSRPRPASAFGRVTELSGQALGFHRQATSRDAYLASGHALRLFSWRPAGIFF